MEGRNRRLETGDLKRGREFLGEARKAKWKAAPQAEEDLENPEGMAEPLPKNSAESSGALTPHAREEACKNAAAQSASHSANRRTERRKPRRQEGDQGLSMWAGVGWERSVGLGFFRSKTSDTGNFSRVQNEVKLIFENFSVFLGGIFTTEKGRTRRQRRVWKAANGEQKRDFAQRRRDAEGKRKRGSHGGAETRRKRKRANRKAESGDDGPPSRSF